MNYPTQYPLLVFALSFIALWLSAWVGWSFRRRQGTLDAELHEDFGFILAATLTLLGLIIGFSFSMATSRYDQRKNYEEAEANAIGTEYVRADLLPDADADRVHELLRKYLAERILFYKACDEQELQQINARTANCRPSYGPRFVPQPRHGRPRDGPGCFGHERCIEFAGIHPGWVLESHPNRGMGFDGGNRGRLQLAGRLWFTQRQSGIQIAADSTADCRYRVHAHCRYRLPAPRHYSGEAAESDQPG